MREHETSLGHSQSPSPPHSLRATHDGIGEQQREKEERKGEKESCQILVMKTLFKKR
jgi:hypothetical protein